MDVVKLIKLINPENPKVKNTTNRDYAWNFWNILGNGPSGESYTGKTIEWRQPPGVQNADDCVAWAELALNFIQAAREPGVHQVLELYVPTVEGLKAFVDRGRVDSVTEWSCLEPLFVNKSGSKTPRLPKT